VRGALRNAASWLLGGDSPPSTQGVGAAGGGNAPGTQGAAAGGVNPVGRAVEATSGAEAAARLENLEANYPTAEAERLRAQDFLATAQAHASDPAFMRDMYEELGPELTSQLLGDSVNAVSSDNRNTYQTEEAAQSAFSAVTQGLSAMPESFQQDVGRLAAENNPEAAMLLQNGGSEAASRGFLEGVRAEATAGEPSADANFAARMAGQIIASDPELLQHVEETWSSEEVTNLLENGLETPPTTDAYHTEWASMRADGLERMVGMTAELTGPEHADFRARVFRDASLALEHTRAGDETRQSLVDNLKTLFQSDARGIVSRLFSNDSVSPDSAFNEQALGLFFRDAVFANPNPDAPFNTFVSDLMGDMRADMLDPARIDNDPNTQANDTVGKELGDVLGSLVTGYMDATRQNGEDQAARQAFANTLVGMVAKPFDIGGGVLGDMAMDTAKDTVQNMLGDFLNGELKADRQTMEDMIVQMSRMAFAGTRRFDDRYGTDVETSVKNEAQWVEFMQRIMNQ
jgi:hypothetical protein